MSQHSFKTAKFNVQMGVDRPLSNVFASIFVNDVPEDAEDDNAPGFNPFSWYPVSKVGVQTAIHDVEKYIQDNGEPNFKVPATVQPELEKEVKIHLADPNQSLNFGKNHGFVG